MWLRYWSSYGEAMNQMNVKRSFVPAQVLPCLTVMSSLSRSWTSIDETNFSDLIAESRRGRTFVLGQINKRFICSGCYLRMYWTQVFSLLTRHAAPQNQERPGCSGEAEGVRRYPPTVWQGDESQLTTKGHVTLTLLSVMSLKNTLPTLFE